jgi:hypothetical protein
MGARGSGPGMTPPHPGDAVQVAGMGRQVVLRGIGIRAGRGLVEVELLRVKAGIGFDKDGLADDLLHLLQPL